MGCFQLSTNPIELLFYGLSLLQAFRGVQLGQILWREWGEFKLEPLTPRKAWLGEQAAFFLAIPPSVAVHELFHALPIWAFGGRIARCGYGFYWGFVQADRFFLAEEQWFISLAGTLGSLLFGLTLWLVLRRHRSSSLRYFGLRSLRMQLYFSLIFYPLFSAFTFIGDWRIIYNFERTPQLSGLAVVLHGVGLALMWHGQRQGWFDLPQAESAAQLAQLRQTEAAAAARPRDLASQLQHVKALRQAGLLSQAQREGQKLIRAFPDVGDGYVELALVQLTNQAHFPRAVLEHLQQALARPIGQPDYLVIAHLLLGQHNLNLERAEKALNHLSYAIETAQNIPDQSEANRMRLAQAYYLRAMVHRRQNEMAPARRDIDKAIELARGSGRDELHEHFQTFKQSLPPA